MITGSLRLVFAAVLAVAATPLAACDTSLQAGPPTGATCPTGSTLSWASFGSSFMASYCTRCHRQYTSVSSVRRDAPAIDRYAGSGPAATNTGMPDGSPHPSTAERASLAEWLSCGAP